MVGVRPLINGVLGFLAVASTPFLMGASNPVAVESRSPGTTRVQQAQPREIPFQAPVEVESGMNAIESVYQIQLLQQEVQGLRGTVEELQHQVSRMQATQEDRYLELDRRMRQVLQQGVRPDLAPGTRPSADLPEAVPEDGIIARNQGEKVQYETALELIRNRQYDLSISQLQAVIAQFPTGDYVANAYYWLGEVYSAKPEPDYEKARQAFMQVITYYPDSQKVPDAAFKLGKVYHLIGDCMRAQEALRNVVVQYQGKSAAKLAESYLRDKVDCNP
jgi:tol-pal system protein YbgF